MTPAELAVEHLRMTVLSAAATGTRQATVAAEELAVLLGEYDRLRLAEDTDRRGAQIVRAEFEAGRHRAGQCEDCSCCTVEGCRNGPDGPAGAHCPTDGLGDSVCPCTGD